MDLSPLLSSKENFPLVASGLSQQSLSDIHNRHENNQISLEEYSDRITCLNYNDEEDPLNAYSQFFNWALMRYPPSNQTILNTLQHALRNLRRDARYKDDPRHLSLWLIVAKQSKSPTDIFKFLSANNIAQQSSKFYIEYSNLLYSSNNLNDAINIITLGINRNAQPINPLHSQLSTLKNIQKSPQESLEEPLQESRQEPLQTISSRIVSERPSDRSIHRTSDRSALRPTQRTSEKPSSSISIFQDPDGSLARSSDKTTAALLPSANPWPHIQLEQAASKENINKSSWSESKFPQSTLPSSQPATHPSIEIYRDVPDSIPSKTSSDPNKKLPLSIIPNHDPFTPAIASNPEPSTQSSHPEKKHSSKQKHDKPSKPSSQAFAFRDDLIHPDESTELSFEELRSLLPKYVYTPSISFESPSIPLGSPSISIQSHYSSETVFPPVVSSTASSSIAVSSSMTNLDSPQRNPSSIPHKSKPIASPTINTKAAMADVFEMFNAPLISSNPSYHDMDYDDETISSKVYRPPVSPSTKLDVFVDPKTPVRMSRDVSCDDTDDMTDAERLAIQLLQKTPNRIHEAGIGFPGPGSSKPNVLQPRSQSSIVSANASNVSHGAVYHMSTPNTGTSDRAPRHGKRGLGILDTMTPIAEVMSDVDTMSMLGTSGGLVGHPIHEEEEEEGVDDDVLEFCDTKGDLEMEFVLDGVPNPCNPYTVDTMTRVIQYMYPQLFCAPKHDHDNVVMYGYDGAGPRITLVYESGDGMPSSSLSTGTKNGQDVMVHGVGKCQVVSRVGSGGFGDLYMIKKTSHLNNTNSNDVDLDDILREFEDMEFHDTDDETEPGIMRIGATCIIKIQSARHVLWEQLVLSGGLRGQAGIRARLRDAGCPVSVLQSIIECHSSVVWINDTPVDLNAKGWLVMAPCHHGTLLDLMNISAGTTVPGIPKHTSSFMTDYGGIHEALAMFYVMEVIRVVKWIHRIGIIHGDVKLDNVMIRCDGMDNNVWTSDTGDMDVGARYRMDGGDGWSTRGIVLVDWGKSVDVTVYPGNQMYCVPVSRDTKCDPSIECMEIRNGMGWAGQPDWYGVAGIAYTLLYGTHMEIIETRDDKGNMRVGLSKPMKRYWQGDLWNEFFELMLNSGAYGRNEGGSVDSQTFNERLDDVMMRFGQWLEGCSHKGHVMLRSMMMAVQCAMVERRRQVVGRK